MDESNQSNNLEDALKNSVSQVKILNQANKFQLVDAVKEYLPAEKRSQFDDYYIDSDNTMIECYDPEAEENTIITDYTNRKSNIINSTSVAPQEDIHESDDKTEKNEAPEEFTSHNTDDDKSIDSEANLNHLDDSSRRAIEMLENFYSSINESSNKNLNSESKAVHAHGFYPGKVNPKDPNTIPKFVDELVIPPRALPLGARNPYSYYEIRMRAAMHYFHRFFPPTMIWGYNGTCPGPTIEVQKDETIQVKWVNNLPSKHFLPIDYTLHGAMDSPDVRSVVHLHGANVDPSSDGHPDAWYVSDYSVTGKTYEHDIYKYTNHQQGTTLWYHDHSLGITRLNVYAGLAGFYIIRDKLEERLNLPCAEYEVPLMIQDKSFNEDGSLFYPDSPPFPVPVKPSIVPAFFGNTIVVNGKVWPYLRVEPRKYRFRILNASNTRAYNLSLSENMKMYQIGTDGGLLHHGVELSSILLEPSERTDVIVDFSSMKGKKITLKNTADPSPNTGVVMEFRVELPLRGKDTSEIPDELYPMDHIMESMANKVRNLTLSATTDHYGRPMLLLNNSMWTDPCTEKPELDSVEVWNILNLTAFPHPVHVHLVQFKILDRRPFNLQVYQTTGKIEYTGPAVLPEDFERGWKDTVRADPQMVTRIIMHFKDHPGDFVWHCHILEHEDHDMMRPLRVTKDCYAID